MRLKLNTIKSEFKDKNVLLVDDSIVRGTTSMELVQVTVISAYPCLYIYHHNRLSHSVNNPPDIFICNNPLD